MDMFKAMADPTRRRILQEQMYCRFLDVFDGMSFHGKAQKHEK